MLRRTYRAETVAVVPGGGTYAMEAVARQLATGRRCLVVRNGLFSYRWSQIFDAGSIPAETGSAAPGRCPTRGTRPGPRLRSTRWWKPSSAAAPKSSFAAHVETAAGLVLPDDYLRAVAAATHEVGGLVVLDCIASGSLWVDMTDLGDRRSPQRAAEGLERHAVRGLRDAQRGRRGAGDGHHLDELCRGSPDVADDHRGLHQGRRPTTQPCQPTGSRTTLLSCARPTTRAGRAAPGPDRPWHPGAHTSR